MIKAHQPTIFPANVRVAISSADDGSMKDGTDLKTARAIHNREVFLANLGMPVEKSATFAASFDGNDFCRYTHATPGLTIGVDAMVTSDKGCAILVPLADCTGAVLYDPEHHALMVSHLGRHSTEQFGGERSVKYMQDQFGSDPAKLLIWLSPSPNGEDYPLYRFENRSFNDVLTEQLKAAGAKRQNIEISTVDTIKSPHYFSHSEFLKGRRESDGRYAIVAMLI